MEYTYKVTLGSVRITTVAIETQQCVLLKFFSPTNAPFIKHIKC